MKLIVFLAFLLPCISLSQSAPLQLNEIMAGDDFIGHQPENIRWSAKGDVIYFDRYNTASKKTETYALDPKTNNTTIIPSEKVDQLVYHRENPFSISSFFAISGNSLISYDIKSNKRLVHISTSENKSELQHVKNPQVVYFRQGLNLFRFDKELAQIKVITNFVEGNEKAEKNKDYLQIQEENLFEAIKERNKNSPIQSNNVPKPIFLGDQLLYSISVSPNEDYILYNLSNKNTPNYTEYTEFITTEGYVKSRKARPKVGTVEPPVHRLFVHIPGTDSIKELDFSNLSGIRKRPEYQKEYGLTDRLEKDKSIIIHEPIFNFSGTKALLSVKSFDNKDRWLLIYDLASGELKEIEHQHDEAWIGGPGISNWNYSSGNIGWMKNSEMVYFQSEESGYSHLYFFDLKTGKREQLTDGNFEIHQAQLSKDGNIFYITANKSHPGNQSFYHFDWKTKKWKDIFVKDGYHEVILSPDEKSLAVRYSYKNKPWELYLSSNRAGSDLKQITISQTDKFKSYNWIEPDLITFKARDDKEVYARLYKPNKSKSNGAAIIFVHGAGYLQNAHNWWSGYHREYMFHNLLTEMGYTVLDIDYRASKGYGRDHRTAIYRHMGGTDLNDQIDGKNWLVKNVGVDPNKVGIYGGSYGGFITLMALLTAPEEFQCGGALRSVTDWAHYNHGYTSNILNTPEEDSIAYKRSSPIYFAEGLQKRLILFHGMVDDNVQYQDVIRLTQRFIELGKTDWDLVSYPVEAHGFTTTSAWTDEYRRLLQMFNNYLLNE
ncbi:MAG: prolyl oligopeptidase family serine peptidase [Brumimicrobium sp.]|nr:prolyl oligopeptidase family serine peptidase [Brumimicrobium sp.]